MIAHRGASGYLPENTLAAYALALEQRADMIEIDLHQSRDAAVVIAHDEQLEALGGRGAIADAALADLLRLDAGQGQRLPQLDEILDRFGSRIPFNLELKVSRRGEYGGLEERALAAVRARGLLADTLFSSFSERVLGRLRSLEPSSRLALLISPEDPSRPFERATALAAEAVNPWHGLVDRAFVEGARSAGLRVLPYTVDAPERQRALLELGVDGLFTNFPDRLRALLPA